MKERVLKRLDEDEVGQPSNSQDGAAAADNVVLLICINDTITTSSIEIIQLQQVLLRIEVTQLQQVL